MPAERCPSSPGSMRLVILSDTHGNHRRLEMPEDADILIHAGDFTQLGKRSDAEDFNAWLGTLPYAHKLVVVGNHEEKADWRCTAADILTNATLLCNTGVNICGLNIFGCTFYWPVESPFFQPPYNMIPADTHVLISHGPARHHVDAGVGCPYMLTHIARVRPLLFVCGHIHEARGACVGRDESVATTTFVNAANGAPHDSAKRGNNHNSAACTFSKERSSSGGGGGSGGAAEAATCRSTVDVEVPRSRRQPVLATVRDWQPERLKSGVSKAMKALLAPVAATGANFTSRDALATGSGPAALHAGVEGNGSGGIVGAGIEEGKSAGQWVDSDTWYALTGPPTAPSTLQGARPPLEPSSPPPRFVNLRTGDVASTPPDGTRDGVRRRSAARSGAWAVPFVSPPPELPAAVFAPPACDLLSPELLTFWHNAEGGSGGSGGARDPPSVGGHGSSEASAAGAAASGDVDAGSRDGRVHGALRPTPALLVFTAPHGINLLRDGRPEHLPEDFTSYIAKAWAAQARGASVCWGGAALAWCTRNQRALPGARDPNYLTEAEADAQSNAWVRALHDLKLSLPPPPSDLEGTHAARCKPPLDMSEAEAEAEAGAGADARPAPLIQGFHVDVHGKADRAGEADLDVGVGALRASFGDEIADRVADVVAEALWAALERGGAGGGAGGGGAGGGGAGGGGAGGGGAGGDAAGDGEPVQAASTMSVDARPRLQGCWRSVPRWTLTQSSVRLGFVSVQLEMGYGLRRALARDRILCAHLADAFVECAPACLEAVAAHTCSVSHAC